MEKPVSRKIVRNTCFVSLGKIWSILLSFLITPYILTKLGIDQYGLWALISVVINYFNLFDFGISSAFVKYSSEFYAKRDFKRMSELINTGIAYYFLFSLLVVPTYFLLENRLLNFFNFTQESSINEVSYIFRGVLAIFIFKSIFMVFGSVLNGIQRMDISNTIKIVVSTLSSIGSVAFLMSGFGLKGLVYNGFIMAILLIAAQVYYTFLKVPEICLSIKCFRIEMLRKLFNFGVKMQISKFSEMINGEVDKILISHFISIQNVSFYDLGRKIVRFTEVIPSMLLPAIEPAASELHSLDDERRLKILVLRSTKYSVFISLPMSVFFIYNASNIIGLWVNQLNFEKSVLTISILTAGYFLGRVIAPSRMVLRGMGLPKYEMNMSFIIAVCNIILSTALIIKIGFIGALIGTAASSIIGQLYFFYLFNIHMKKFSKGLLKETIITPLIASIIALGVVFLLESLGSSLVFSQTRVGYFLTLLISFLLFSITYLAAVFKSNYFDKEDLFMLSKKVWSRAKK